MDILDILSYPVRFLRSSRQFVKHWAMAVCFKVFLQCNQNVWSRRQDKETNRKAGKELLNIQVGYLDSECNSSVCLRRFTRNFQNRNMEAQVEPGAN